MLVLSRKRNEEIIIGPLPDGRLVRVTVLDVNGDRVRLGFDADREVEILRSELVGRDDRPRVEAA